ncbi:MAG TPA: hypothetical protein VNA89_01870 [Gemmatimonadaceae bacterium]|nr:hypothetical protein [Gemmatimonadaceae bacterium]
MRSPLPTLPTLVALAILGCGGGSSAPPGTGPRPTPLPNAPREWRIARRGDTAAYAVYLAARVRGPDDGRGEVDDSTVTVARLRLTMAPDGRTVAGVIDSIGIRGTGRVAAMPGRVDSVAFAGTVDADGRIRALAAGASTTGPVAPAAPIACDVPAAVFASIMHDVVVPLPSPQLAVGMRWTDTVTAVSCRGGLTITTVAIRRHELRRAASLEGVDALEVDRESALQVEGEGTRGDRTYGVRGGGRERATLFVRPIDGALLRLDGESSLDMEFTAPDARTRLEQEGHRIIRRQ